MSLSAFLAQNAVRTEPVRFAVSSRFLGEDGEAEPWEIRCLTAAEDESLRRSCARCVPVPGRRGLYLSETDAGLYPGRLAAACTVYPDLNDRSLQDSYGVMGAEELLRAMLTAGEYAAYLDKVQEVCGFARTMQDEVNEAKN